MTTPNQILIPFAKDGQKASVPQTGTPENTRASYTEGFPPNTMIPLSQGGIPPYGQDFNGVLNDITTQVQYLQAGAFYPYNAEFATAIGGYPVGAMVLKSDGTGRWRNTVANNMTNPDSASASGWVSDEAKVMTGATESSGGTSGLVPAPIAGDGNKFLAGDGTFKHVSGVPIGTIEYFATATPPVGYLKADGAAVGRETYPDLYAAIGTAFGEGDGSTTFNLPDLMGRFAQGSNTPGQKIEAGLPKLTGKVADMKFGTTGEIGGSAFYGQNTIANNAVSASGSAVQIAILFDASRSNPIYGASNTVQPPALTLLPCIKAFDAATNPGLIDITELANEMAGLSANKLDKTINGTTVKYVTETYNDGNNWYRKWSDGWVEQGIYGIAVTASQMTVTLPVAFASGSYTVVTEVLDRGARDYGEGVSVSARTSTGIVCHGYNSDATTAVMMSLYVCGQGA